MKSEATDGGTKPNDSWLDFSDALKKIAARAKIKIYCEFYPRNNPLPPAAVTLEGPLHQVLNAVANSAGYNVVKHNGAYFLWSRSWFLERPSLPPAEQYDTWLATAQSGQPFTLDQMMAMYQLTSGQIEFMSRTPLGISANPGPTRWMRFLAALSPSQRAQVFGETGLEASLLTPQQISLLPTKSEDCATLELRYQTSEKGNTALKISGNGSESEFYVLLLPRP